MEWLVVGLGNPGGEYELTPHNIGFMVCDSLSSLFNFSFFDDRKFKGSIGKFKIDDINVMVLKPMTYMNLSGISVASVVGFFKFSLERIIVIHDDIDLPLGRIRIKRNSSSGGHKGVESVILYLGSKDFVRIKVGVGKSGVAERFVLSRFPDDKTELLNRVVLTSADAVIDIVKKGVEYSMNKYNGLKMEV